MSMTGGEPSSAGMASSFGMSDSTTQGLLSLGDQGGVMNMAQSGNVVPMANPSPSNGLNAQPVYVPSSTTTMMPTAQAATRMSNDQVQKLLAYATRFKGLSRRV